MKKELIKKYPDQLLNVYHNAFLKHCPYDYVVVLKDKIEDEIKDHILYTNYQNFYTYDYLKYPIPPIRKPHKLLTYMEGIHILEKREYGSLVITHDLPYCITMNHFIVDGHIYFHTGYNGFKLNGINKLACFHVVNDLGIHKEAFTHNHESVVVYGFLKEVKENKKALLNAFMNRYTPGYMKELDDQMISRTMILELSIEHMIVKRHYH